MDLYIYLVLLAIPFFISLLVALLLVIYSHFQVHLTINSSKPRVQKFHTAPIPRFGGVGIILGMLFAFIFLYFQSIEIASICLLLIIFGLPTFLSGLFEDFTGNVSLYIRFSSSLFSAALVGYFLNTWLSSFEIQLFDYIMLSFPFMAVGITCFAVTGVINSFNIIDGYHGISSMVAIIILLGLAHVAFQVADQFILIAALVMISALIGFLMLNYPRGLVFLGDGGAYFIGFWIAELSILLTSRNSEVSKWFPLLLCFYPVFETLFTIYRRIFLKKTHPWVADATHLHQLIYRRIVRFSAGHHCNLSINKLNSMTLPYVCFFTGLSAISAILFWRNHVALKVLFILFSICYTWFYWSIVRFKVQYLIRICITTIRYK